MMDTVAIICNASMVVDGEGMITDIGLATELEKKYLDCKFLFDIDMTGKCLLPGFVDAHTHPVWSGDRSHEMKLKLEGASYLDIHNAGGGIGFTVDHTTKSSDEKLLQLLKNRLKKMVKNGTTLVEAKSGYGLKEESEIRLLRILKQANRKAWEDGPGIEIVSTYCGAHSIPQGKTEDEATEDIIVRQIPSILSANQRGEIEAENFDVFCEKGVFEIESTKKLLLAAKNAGFCINFHGDELNNLGSAKMGAEFGARAISHLEMIDSEGILSLSHRNDNNDTDPCIAVLLPTTAHVLRLTPPPAGEIIRKGNVPVALGSDFNPNAHCLSMPMVMNLACCLYKMTMNEALVAATLNAAASLNRAHSHGSLEKGKVADIVVLDAPRWEHVIYQFGDPPIHSVYKRGKLVFESNESFMY